MKWHNSGTVDSAQSSMEQATSHNVRQKLSYTQEGKKQIKQTIDYYMENARILRESLTELGLTVYGGENAPYLWVKTPADAPSWKFFEDMLNGAQVVCTPGVGFGLAGEGFIRITSFGDRNDCVEAMARIKKWLNK